MRMPSALMISLCQILRMNGFRPPAGLHRQDLQRHEDQRAGDNEAQRQENPDFLDHRSTPRRLG